MSEIVSPESKLYVKEEVEKAKKEIKEDIEKANSKAARTFTIVGIVLGILTGLGVYGLATSYMEKAIREGLGKKAIQDLLATAEQDVKEIRGYKEPAKKSFDEIENLLKQLKEDGNYNTFVVGDCTVNGKNTATCKLCCEQKGANCLLNCEKDPWFENNPQNSCLCYK